MTHLTVKNEFSKNVQCLQFFMVQGSLNPNITFLCEKLWQVAWNPKFTSVIQSIFLTWKNWSWIKSFEIKISRSSILHIVVWSQRFCYIPFFWCNILSNKNAQIEKVTNNTSEKHTLLDLFVAMGFDERTFFRDGIEWNICYS